MFSTSQLSSFTSAVSAARFAVFACKMIFRGQTITGVSTAIKTGVKLEEGGFTYSHDAIARIPLVAAAPQGLNKTGEIITLFLAGGPAAGQRMRIDEILLHPNNPEYRLGLGCL